MPEDVSGFPSFPGYNDTWFVCTDHDRNRSEGSECLQPTRLTVKREYERSIPLLKINKISKKWFVTVAVFVLGLINENNGICSLFIKHVLFLHSIYDFF